MISLLRKGCFSPASPIALLCLLLLSAAAAHAATIYYVKPGGTGTGTGSWSNAMGNTQLQAAVNAVALAGGGQVWVVAGTYKPNAYPAGASSTTSNQDYAFTLANGVAIYGGFAGTETLLSQRNYTTNVTILSGDINTSGTYTDDCYHILLSTGNDNTAILDGFTIEYGYATGGTSTITYSGIQMDRNHGGAIYIKSSQPLISNCQFLTNVASSGGAIYNDNSSAPPVFTNCNFSGNSARTTASLDGGGAVCNANNTYITLASCTFSNNTSASDGGGIFSNNSCKMTLTSCTFTSNTASGSGGGFVNEASSAATLTNCTFTSNKANSTSAGGGAVCNNATNFFSAASCSFTGNISGYYGGGIFFTSGSSQSSMTNCTFASNSAVYGGGIGATIGSNQTITSSAFNNNASTYGGGIYNNSSSFTYDSCTFKGNSASAATGMAGGGEVNDNSSNGTMLHCLFLNNVSAGDGAGQYCNNSNSLDSECVFNGNVSHGNGGGLVYNGGNPKSWNCVLSDNMADSYGGGLYNIGANATFMNNTVYNNAANSAGGYGDGIYVASGSPKIYNDIVWSRSNAASLGLVYASGVTPKVQYSDTQGTLFAGTGNISTVPSFGNSGNYVGTDGIWATADDGLHLTGSMATDAIPTGSATLYDITMTNRPIPGPQSDMGAYEGGGTFIVLAAQLLNITAIASGGSTVNLDWQVAGVTAPAGFQVQRSLDGLNFSSIGSMDLNPGQGQYTFIDRNATAPVNYYRVRLDATGDNVLISPVVVVREKPEGNDALSICSFNAARSVWVLNVHSGVASPVNIIVFDASGRMFWRWAANLTQGDNVLSLSMPSPAGGIYYLSVIQEGGGRKTIPFYSF